MKPDWEKLEAEYAGHASVLIGDVDCTAEGKNICSQVGVKGYPTIKYGDINDLQDYKGGRDYAALKAHAGTLGPSCGPAHMDLCSADARAAIEVIQAMSSADLDAAISDADAKLADAEAFFTAEVAKLQATYEKLNADKSAVAAEVAASNVGTMKAVRAHRAKSGHDEL